VGLDGPHSWVNSFLPNTHFFGAPHSRAIVVPYPGPAPIQILSLDHGDPVHPYLLIQTDCGGLKSASLHMTSVCYHSVSAPAPLRRGTDIPLAHCLVQSILIRHPANIFPFCRDDRPLAPSLLLMSLMLVSQPSLGTRICKGAILAQPYISTIELSAAHKVHSHHQSSNHGSRGKPCRHWRLWIPLDDLQDLRIACLTMHSNGWSKHFHFHPGRFHVLISAVWEQGSWSCSAISRLVGFVRATRWSSQHVSCRPRFSGTGM